MKYISFIFIMDLHRQFYDLILIQFLSGSYAKNIHIPMFVQCMYVCVSLSAWN